MQASVCSVMGYCAYALAHRMARQFPEAMGMFSDRYDVEDLDSPELRAMFIRHNNGVDLLVNLLDDPVVLMKQIEHVVNQHSDFEGVKRVLTVSLICTLFQKSSPVLLSW